MAWRAVHGGLVGDTGGPALIVDEHDLLGAVLGVKAVLSGNGTGMTAAHGERCGRRSRQGPRGRIARRAERADPAARHAAENRSES